MSPIITQTRARVVRAGDYFSELWSRREFAWFLAMGNLKARNASTALGLLWWVINPLLLGLVYFVVFGVIFESGRDISYLLSGMFVFHFTSQAMTGGANSILQNSKLLANIRFPRLILPIANLLEATVGFLASLLVLYAIAIPGGHVHLNLNFLLLAYIIPVHLLFNLGLGALTARLAVPFRDINNIIPYINRLWLYLSPIIWPIEFMDRLTEPLQQVMLINPMFSIIGVYRAALLGDTLPPGLLLRSGGMALAISALGMVAFMKYESRIVRHL
ncbi:MAG: ABC transporter permease [Acidimicrobiia bacterium]|nr:ABC transporter permease [Acidimicrobiia bacterium]